MNKKSDNLFSILGSKEIPSDLYEKIVFKIEKASIRKAKISLFYQGLLAVVSFASIFPVFIGVIKGFSQSGFWQYFSLIFTDGGIVLSNWKVFLTSLLESAPFYEMTFFLIIVFVLLESAKFASGNYRQVFYQQS